MPLQAVSERDATMKRMPLILWGTALSLAVIGFEVTLGKDLLQTREKEGALASEKGAAKPVPAKQADKADVRASADLAEKKSDERPISADEKAIRLTGDTYLKAFREADGKSIAAHFTPDAEYID